MRQDDAFRAALLLSYLQGEPKSAAALSDFLEEQGELRIKAYGDRHSRMQVALGILPSRLAHELACEFAERALNAFGSRNPDHEPLHDAILAKRRWLAGKIGDEELVERRKAAFRLAEAVREEAQAARNQVRSRRLVIAPYHWVWSDEALQCERICQAAGHAASFAVHTTALYAARFAVYATRAEVIRRQQEEQVELLEATLASHAYVSVY